MKSNIEINREIKEVYLAIIEVMKIAERDYCLSWWLNTKNFNLKSKLSTPEIVRRAKVLVKMGYLIIDKKMTHTYSGTCYRLTEKKLI